MREKKNTQREFFIDYTRGLAIIIATGVHVLSAFFVWEYLSNLKPFIYTPIVTFSTIPTPTLLIIFGMMIHIVYLKIYKERGQRVLVKKVFTRALYIYIVYSLTILIYHLINGFDLELFTNQLLFLVPGNFTSILVMYFFAIFTIPLLIYILERYGVYKLFLLSLGIFALQTVIPYTIIPEQYRFLSSLTLGIGDQHGPSTLSALLPISLGILYAKYTIAEKRVSHLKMSLILIGLLLLTTLIVTKNQGIHSVVDQYITRQYRMQNDLEYYLIGPSIGFITILTVYIYAKIPNVLKSIRSIFSILNNYLMYIGKHALISYSVGSVILSIIPHKVQITDPLSVLGVLFAVLLAQIGSVFVFVEVSDFLSYLSRVQFPRTKESFTNILSQFSVIDNIKDDQRETL